MEQKLLRLIQSRVARTAVGASAVRGRGNEGTVEVTRGFFRTIDLRRFGTSDPEAFATQLDRHTERLRKRLPNPRWGLARKAMNLFLMDCFYNRFLSEEFRVCDAEPLLELPLDSVTGRQLASLKDAALPAWPGVKYLTPRGEWSLSARCGS